jgi:hypothetical protein
MIMLDRQKRSTDGATEETEDERSEKRGSSQRDVRDQRFDGVAKRRMATDRIEIMNG